MSRVESRLKTLEGMLQLSKRSFPCLVIFREIDSREGAKAGMTPEQAAAVEQYLTAHPGKPGKVRFLIVDGLNVRE